MQCFTIPPPPPTPTNPHPTPVLEGRGNSGAQAVLSAPMLITSDDLGMRQTLCVSHNQHLGKYAFRGYR